MHCLRAGVVRRVGRLGGWGHGRFDLLDEVEKEYDGIRWQLRLKIGLHKYMIGWQAAGTFCGHL